MFFFYCNAHATSQSPTHSAPMSETVELPHHSPANQPPPDQHFRPLTARALATMSAASGTPSLDSLTENQRTMFNAFRGTKASSATPDARLVKWITALDADRLEIENLQLLESSYPDPQSIFRLESEIHAGTGPKGLSKAFCVCLRELMDSPPPLGWRERQATQQAASARRLDAFLASGTHSWTHA